MDIIKELEYYCDTANPVGTLMLSGEWGCGKTYLIKNKLAPAMKDKYVVLCISLFGLDSIDAIRQEVKRQWLEKAVEIVPIDGERKILSKAAKGYEKAFKSLKDILPDSWQKGGEVVSTIMNLANYIPVTNTMGKKKVILVFDDLERSTISSADILGCINDYCENQHFNVIIVANEDKIKRTASGWGNGNETQSSDTFLSYDEIKEKIVQRVIHFIPDYTEVVVNSIECLGKDTEYNSFLRRNKEMLVKILEGDIDNEAILAKFKKDNYRLDDNKAEYDKKEKELKELLEQRPHNIRSFKCAIQDFKRIYTILKNVGIEDCDNWLISFTCYMMAYKAGLISDAPDCGFYLSIERVKELYPDIFNSDYIVSSIACWLIKR